MALENVSSHRQNRQSNVINHLLDWIDMMVCRDLWVLPSSNAKNVLAVKDRVACSTTTDRSNDSYTAPGMHAQQKDHLPAETREYNFVHPLGSAFEAKNI